MIASKMANIYLAHANISHRLIVKKIKTNASKVHWLYLGRDFSCLKKWERSLGSGFERIVYAKYFQDIALQLSKSYVDWIAILAKRFEGLTWWSSTIAEKNTAEYSLYHTICYLYVTRSIGCNTETPLLIIAESKYLLRAIAELEEFKNRVYWISWNIPSIDYAVRLLKIIRAWMIYFMNCIKEIRDATQTKRHCLLHHFKSERPRILVNSCLDESYFGENESANNRYFTVLPEELESRGYEVITIPWLFNLERSRREALEWFRKKAHRYLIPSDYYNWRDYLWAAWTVFQQINIPSGRQIFHGMDITQLVIEHRLLGARNTNAATFVLYYRLIKHLSEKGIKIDIYLDTFENMYCEKPQIMALRKYMPNVITIGFQHYISTYPLWLCQYCSLEENDIVPHPDIIVCNSKFTADIFERNGFNKEKIRIGPSLRYLNLLKGQIKEDLRVEKCVFVVLTINPYAVLETICKLTDAFPDYEGIRFVLKLHPMMSENQLTSILANHKLPEHMTVVTNGFDHWLREISCAIIMVSTAPLELLLHGIPVIILGRETDFDMNALAWFPEFDKPVHTVKELRDSLLNILFSLEDKKAKVRAWAKNYRDYCLSPINDETIAAFIKGMH